MAFPANALNVAAAPTRTGITLSIGLSSNRTLAVEIQRKSTASTWQTRDILPGVALSQTNNLWTDALPLDYKKYWYRARDTFPGTWPSAWTTAAGGYTLPAVLSNNTPAPLALTGKGVGFSLFMQTPQDTLKIGTAQATTYLSKKLTFNFSAFLSVSGTPSYSPGQYAVTVGALALGEFQAPVALAPGCTIRKISITGESSAGGGGDATLYNNGSFIHNSPTLSTAGLATKTSTAFAYVTSSSQNLYIIVALTNGAAPPNPYYKSVGLEYSMPTYDKAV